MNLKELFPLVFCTNMDYRPDRLTIALQEINKVGIIPIRLPGVVYTGTPNRTWNGMVGCGLCHLNGLRIARERNMNVLMFEDDVLFINDYPTIIQNAINELPENWDMFYLGGNICNAIYQVSPYLGKLTHAQSTHSYGVNKNFLDKLITHIEGRMEHQIIDVMYANEVIPNNNCFITIPMSTIQREDHSDIMGGTVNYSSWMEQRFYGQLVRKA